jgi:two-component system response regulator VicR
MRVRAHLRQFEQLSQNVTTSICEGSISIDMLRHRVLKDGQDLAFTPKEFMILSYLAQHKSEIVTREQLTREVWGDDYYGEISSVPVYIRKIREKIEDDPSHPALLRTMRNVGYIFGL